MKLKLFAILCALLLLTACQPPDGPTPTEPTTEAATAATTPTNPPPERLTEPSTEPATSVETSPPEPATEAATTVDQSPTQPATEAATTVDQSPIQLATARRPIGGDRIVDEVNHPIHGPMDMTSMEREYTLAVSARQFDVLAALQDDPRYQDICGGFGYRAGVMYIFSLDDATVDALVKSSMELEDIAYQLVETPVSLRRLNELYMQLDADHEKYGIEKAAYQPRYNQVVAVVKDLEAIDPDLQKLADETRCVKITDDAFIPPPFTPRQGISREPNTDGFGITTEYSMINLVISALMYAEPSEMAYVVKDADFNGGVVYVYDLERAKEAINASEEARNAYAELGDRVQLVQVIYGPVEVHNAQVAMMNALEPLLPGPYYSTYDFLENTVTAHGKGLSDPAVQKAARDAAYAAIKEYTGETRQALTFTFADEEITRAGMGDDRYDGTYVGGPPVDGYYAIPWSRPPLAGE